MDSTEQPAVEARLEPLGIRREDNMSSETEHDITKQPEPTCPMIDALQKKLRDADRAMRKFERCDDAEQLRDMLDSVRRELFHWDTAEDSLEAIRKHVESIRAWGEEWKQYALKLHLNATRSLAEANSKRDE